MAKYLEVAEILKSRIQHGDYLLAPMPGERRIAEEIGVSYMTARKAIRHLMDAGHIARPETGKTLPPRPARQFCDTAFLAPAFASLKTISWQMGLERVVNQGRRIMKSIYFVHWNDPAISEAVANFDLIFLLPKIEAPPAHILNKLRESGKRVVVLEADWSDQGFYSVVSTPAFTLQKLIDHLGENGEKVDCFNVQPIDEVIRQYIDQWQANPHRGECRNHPVEFYQDTLPHAVETAWRLLREEHWRPRAVFCTTLSAAIGLSRVFHDFGLRPGADVRLAAVNGESWAPYLIPSITTLETCDFAALAVKALRAIEHSAPVSCIHPDTLAIRYGESSTLS